MTHWSAVRGERFRVHSWSDEEGVVFDTHSGDTHLLEPLTFELLRRLQAASPRSAHALLGDIAGIVDAFDAGRARAAVEASLRRMRDMGLVVDAAN